MPIRILLLDDHTLFRESLSRLLASEPDLEVAGCCGSLDEACRLIRDQPVDVVLLDFDLGTEHGSDFMQRAKDAGYSGRVLAVTAGVSDLDAVELLSKGVSGIFLKNSPPESLIEAIHRTMAGIAWVDQRAVQALAQSARSREEASDEQNLSPREKQVLQGVFEGLTNKEIGTRLAISETSVKATLQHLFYKTGVRSRSQLVRIALERYGHDWGKRE